MSEPSWQPCTADNWRRLQVKRAFAVTLGKMLQSSPAHISDEEVTYLKAQHVQWYGITLADLPTMWASEAEINALRVNQGDLLVCEGGEVGRSAIVGDSPNDGTIIQNALHLVRGRNGANTRFLYYLLRHAFDQGWFDVICNKSTIAHFTVEKFEDMWAWLPDNSKQRAIADYLDLETARLDALLAEKKRLLDLLTEKRRALITRAVIRGLNPNVPLRDSGIPWLGEIPAHWKVIRLKFVSTESLAYGANEAALDDDQSFPRFVRITDINEKGNLIDETFRSLEPTIAEPYMLNDGDILFARSGATVGKAFLYKKSWGPSCFAGYLIRLRCDKRLVRPEFIFAYTQSDPYWSQLQEGTIQATIQNFSAEKYGHLLLILPPLWEQSEILDQLSKSLSRLETLRSSAESTIALLKERRAALIAVAVTGQIDMEQVA